MPRILSQRGRARPASRRRLRRPPDRGSPAAAAWASSTGPTQLALDRTVALKVIAPALAEDPSVPRALRARVASSPRRSTTRTSSRSTTRARSDGRAVHRDALRRGRRPAHARPRRRARSTRERAATIVAQVGGALDAAHARGLVHRDVKPANVLLGASDHAYLTDFGLTKRVGVATRARPKPGHWVGTLDYVAPEQIRGERVDARADVYALGCVLFYALTGGAPFPRDSDEATLWAHLHDDPPPPRVERPDARRSFDAVDRARAGQGPRGALPVGRRPRPRGARRGRAASPARAGASGVVARGAAAPAEAETAAPPDQAPTVLADARRAAPRQPAPRVGVGARGAASARARRRGGGRAVGR